MTRESIHQKESFHLRRRSREREAPRTDERRAMLLSVHRQRRGRESYLCKTIRRVVQIGLLCGEKEAKYVVEQESMMWDEMNLIVA